MAFAWSCIYELSAVISMKKRQRSFRCGSHSHVNQIIMMTLPKIKNM